MIFVNIYRENYFYSVYESKWLFFNPHDGK